MNNILLELKNISFLYDSDKPLFQDLSFSVSQGEVLSIIGKNGTGKSTLLKIITGIQKKYSGAIIRNTTKISYVPQKLELEKSFPLTVGEFFTIFNNSTSLKNIENTTQLLGITKLVQRNIHTLSGGEFQKVLIANALISEPLLLVLDEPTTGIDLAGEEQFYKVIAETKAALPKLTIILVSHNLRLVYKNSDRVICLHENNFCCHGTPSEVSQNSDVQSLFGEYLRPYEHHPHSSHNHTH